MVLLGIGNFEIEPLVVTASIDVILQNKVIGLEDVAFIIIVVNIQQVAALEVRIKDETAVVVFRLDLCSFGLYLWEIALSFGFEVDPSNIDEDVCEVVLLGSGVKAMVVDISVLINIPESASEFFLAFGVELFYLFLHFAMFKECVLDGDEPTVDIFAGLLGPRQDVAVGPRQLFSIEAAGRVDFVGLGLAIQQFTGSWDMFEYANLNFLVEWSFDGFLLAVCGVIEISPVRLASILQHQRITFINNIICYNQLLASLAN